MDTSLGIARMIDHSLLHPTLSDDELEQGCEVARRCHAATACVKPYHIRRAAELLAGSDVLVCGVIGFPHGNSATAVKVFETDTAMEDGAVEIDMVVNIGKVLSGDWAYVESEIVAVSASVRSRKGILKVIFENDFLDEGQKIRLCEICSRAKVDFVKTSTGYNFVKTEDGRYFTYKGATDADLALMREHSDPSVQVKAAGKIGDLDSILRVRSLGVTRVGTKATDAIVAEARARFGS
jgi:deoxyribose-phosphate aldolase